MAEDTPAHACAYCGIHEAACVVKCNVPQCQKWFCNAQIATSGSHIVNHLVRSKHKEVQLHPNGILGDHTLECYNCGSRNIFILGYIPSPGEGVVVLLCREPCLTQNSLRDSEFNVKDWLPLIENRCLVNWLVCQPDQQIIREQVKGDGACSAQKINRIEEIWKSNANATIDDIDRPGIDESLPKVRLCYEDGAAYRATFSKLIDAEAEYDKRIKESQKQQGVSVRWDVGLNGHRLAYFVFAKEDNESRVVVGDELKLIYHYAPPTQTSGQEVHWEAVGQVVRLTQTEEVCLELRSAGNASGPWDEHITSGFTVEFVWKATSFERMQNALQALATQPNCISNYLYEKLMGHDVQEVTFRNTLPTNFSAPNLAPLNPSQVAAVKKALQSPLCLIQGPPGTGKTVTSATIVYHLVQLNKREDKKERHKVLVVAPSNVAVDQLAEKIHRTGVNVVRVSAKSRETISSNVEFLCLHNQILQFKLPGDSATQELHVLTKLKEEIGELSGSDERKLKSLRNMIEHEILAAADVICATCVAAGDGRLNGFTFEHVLLDEATQATEPECIIPIVNGAKQVVLVGDHCQLGPVIMCKKAAKAGMSLSLFERIIILGNRPMRLEVQYRMHPCLSEFPSMKFYDGALQNGVTLKDRQYRCPNGDLLIWPNPEKPMFFYNCTGYEEISASGTSYLNRNEAAVIEKFVTSLLRSGLNANQIGVITPYDGQRAYLSTLFSKQAPLGYNSYADIEIASVDAFQGREKDFILLTCVRNNRNLGIGFLQDPRRLNVALTRAKYGLIICGNARVLSRQFYKQQHKVWTALLQHFQSNDLIVEGPINNMRVCRNIIPTDSTAGE